MKKFFIYLLVYIIMLIMLVTKDRYYGNGWVGINGTLSWEQIYKTEFKGYLILVAIFVLLCYMAEVRNRKKKEKSDDLDKSDDNE
jgi:uncharacterized membrane protein